MTPELLDKIKKDFDNNKRATDLGSYLAGYQDAIKRFGQRQDRREIRSKQGYSRIGLNNI
jgi:hypothetical protein